MLTLQNEINCKVNLNWKEAGYPWLRAAWVECAEMMDYLGYKWWKQQEINKVQAQMELVDVMHFILAESIICGYTAEDLEFLLTKDLQYISPDKDTLKVIEDLVYALLSNDGECYEEHYITIFALLCDQLDLSFDDLYNKYIGKNVLNKFRQANGYKEGTYIKIWSNKEDNYYLEQILIKLPLDIKDIESYIYNELAILYKQLV